ncbi:MAG: IS630 family transposase [Thermotogota bacterium]|nr:IS630 family transposase [Thermotogota bacterium]
MHKASSQSITTSSHNMQDDFLSKYKTEANARVRIRMLGLAHIQEGKHFTDVARILKVSRKTVSSWLDRFISEGFDGLYDKPGRGRKPKLPASEEEHFKKIVLKHLSERNGGRIKGEEIRQILKDQFNVKYSLSGVYELLKRLKLVWITVRSTHPKADPEEQKAFKENFNEKAKEVLPDHVKPENVDIWFQDEARVGQRGTSTRVWAEKGTRPRSIQQQQFLSAYIFGAFCPENNAAAGIIMPKSDTEAMEIHLKAISDKIAGGRHGLIVLDRAAWHITGKLQCPENISLLPLPPYSPELNPAEQVWQQLRQDSLSNRCFETYENIVDACCDAWNSFTSKAGAIKSLCSRTWADVGS